MDTIRKPQGNRKERKREGTGGQTPGRKRPREKESGTEGSGERDRGWNIANHRISILMLRGGAIVNVEGATLLAALNFILALQIVLWLHKDCASRASVDLPTREREISFPDPMCYFFFMRYLFVTLDAFNRGPK